MSKLRTIVTTTLCGILLATPSFAGQTLSDYLRKSAKIVLQDGEKKEGSSHLIYQPRSNDKRIRKIIPSWDYDLKVINGNTLTISLRKPGKMPFAYFLDNGSNGIKKKERDFAWFQLGDDVIMYNRQNSEKVNQFYLMIMARFVGGYYPFLNRKK